MTTPPGPSLVVGVDVGGTNTDSVLLDTKITGSKAIISWSKSPTASNVTLGVKKTLRDLLHKAPNNENNIAAVTIGTTHFLNAILEHDASRLEKVAVIRLASYNFSSQTPSFIDWPLALKRLIKGHAAIVPGGCNIDGTRIADIDPMSIAEQAEIISSKSLKNVVIAGIGSPMDTQYQQEDQVRDILRVKLGNDVNIVCSHEIAGSGLLARENAAILNASIINFARRTIRGFMQAMSQLGLQCPLYLTANTGHLLSFPEAIQFPIQIFSSGATNSIRGAAYLAGDALGNDGAVVVDIGGTTTDVGYLLRNGYPRLASSHTEIAGIKVNLEVLQVESIGLGGGSLIHEIKDGSTVLVGPDSVGHEITTKALCFGGGIPTATDVAVSSGASIGTTKPVLSRKIVDQAKSRIKVMLENLVDRVKTSAEPCTVILVGGGAVLCPEHLEGVSKTVVPEFAGVANAIGAAIAQISGKAEKMTDKASVEFAKAEVKAGALADAESRGADISGAVITKEQIVGVPYIDDAKKVSIEVACPANHSRFYSSFEKLAATLPSAEDGPGYEETKTIDNERGSNESEDPVVDVSKYRPTIDSSGKWLLSKTDLQFMSIGCYILGCGGGGSPYSTYLEVANIVEEGKTLAIVDPSSLDADAILVPVAGVGSPAVSDERPGGDMVLNSLQTMEKELGRKHDIIMAVEIGGSNGLQPLIWASSKYYNIPCVDGDMMGRAYPNFEKMTSFIEYPDINKLLPVALSSGTGRNVIVPATQPDVRAADHAIRGTCVEMGSACGATGVPISGAEMHRFGIPNTHSLAWRLGRAVSLAKNEGRLYSVSDDIIREFGGEKSAKVIFRGKIISVEHSLSVTAHTTGKVVIQQLSPDELGVDGDDQARGPEKIVVEFVNENLSVKGVNGNGSEEYLAVVPDLIMLLDMATGEAVGTPEYRYGIKVIVMAAAPHPLWTTPRGLEIGGPPGFGLSVEYKPDMQITFGMFGAYIGIVIRIILSIVWYGSQAWLGGLCVAAMFSSWSQSFLNMENTLPESTHMVTRDLIGFLLFHIISIPLLLIRPENVKHPLIAANIISFCVMLAITIWACVKGGAGPLLHQGTTTPGTMPHSWAWLYGLTSSVGGISSGILNQADFTRYLRRQGQQIPGVLFAFMFPGIIIPLFGLLTASASMTIYNDEPIWNPLVLIIRWMTKDYTPSARAAAFFCSFSLVISQLAENILANGYAAGMDLAGLFPRYIDIRRGSVLAALLSWVVQPWLFYNTSSIFVATMSSFSVFLAPLTGIMMCDYFAVRGQRIELSHLYSGRKDGAYWYSWGINWRAVVAWVVCFAPAMGGMIGMLDGGLVVGDGAYKYYWGNYLFGFFEAFVLYYILMKVFPPPRVGLRDEADIYGTFTEDFAQQRGIVAFGKENAVVRREVEVSE
ncbi:hypothetical protein AJ79_01067 [Helicocarpus griseus UAMH5409]|uniref:Hydantoinase/oxoprolinase n=1 Tax=Helicocarpus griseus UAMH5409 TaxID=1447875 RepID=A0A2B7YA51_9EURO|nr:hypothetical protein AJ79_01067 [Helicocarpus griseus UAMH5409]